VIIFLGHIAQPYITHSLLVREGDALFVKLQSETLKYFKLLLFSCIINVQLTVKLCTILTIANPENVLDVLIQYPHFYAVLIFIPVTMKKKYAVLYSTYCWFNLKMKWLP